jgi:hypothetical protein
MKEDQEPTTVLKRSHSNSGLSSSSAVKRAQSQSIMPNRLSGGDGVGVDIKYRIIDQKPDPDPDTDSMPSEEVDEVPSGCTSWRDSLDDATKGKLVSRLRV